MKCPYCEKEMIKGKPIIHEFGSILFKMPATLEFIPDDKSFKKKKADQLDPMEAWYCKSCNKMITITSALD